MVNSYTKHKHKHHNKHKNNEEFSSHEKSINKVILNDKILLEIEQIKEKESLIFKNFLKLLNDNNIVKKAFYNLLFSDIINKINENNYNKNIDEIIEDNYDIIEDYTSGIFNNINNNINITNQIKKGLMIKKKDIQSKIKECNQYIILLKNIYINFLTESIIPIKIDLKMIFDNKKTLFIEDSKDNIILGEFIVRYIFILCDEEYNKTFENLNNLFIPSNFYSHEKLSSFIDEKCDIQEFNKISNIFKYWIFLKCIDLLFSKNSNYETLFNYDELKKYINILSKTKKTDEQKKNEQKKNKQKKKEKSKKKHKGGGDPNIQKFIELKEQQILSGKKTNSNKLNSSALEIIKLLTKCNISIKNENKSINELFLNSFKSNIRNYFKLQFEKKGNYNKLAKNISVKDPFYESDKLDIKYIFKLDNHNNKLSVMNIFNNNRKLKYNFVYSSQILLDRKNDVEKFSNKFKKNLIIILLNLYLIKKDIYENYLKVLELIFNSNNVEENNSNENYNENDNENNNENDNENNNENNNTNENNNLNENMNTNQYNKTFQRNRQNNRQNNTQQINNSRNFNLNVINVNNKNNIKELIKKFTKNKHDLEKFKSNISLYEKKKIELNNLEKQIIVQKYLSKKK